MIHFDVFDRYQLELHHRIAELNKIVQTKEEKIQIYKSKFELLRDKLKKRQEADGSDDDVRYLFIYLFILLLLRGCYHEDCVDHTNIGTRG